jgi:hypothetical protein
MFWIYDLCHNSSRGMDGIKFNIYKALPMGDGNFTGFF